MLLSCIVTGRKYLTHHYVAGGRLRVKLTAMKNFDMFGDEMFPRVLPVIVRAWE